MLGFRVEGHISILYRSGCYFNMFYHKFKNIAFKGNKRKGKAVSHIQSTKFTESKAKKGLRENSAAI